MLMSRRNWMAPATVLLLGISLCAAPLAAQEDERNR